MVVDELWGKVLVGVVVAAVLGVLAWLARPMRDRLDTSKTMVRSTHGLKFHLIRDSAVLNNLPTTVTLGLHPDWLDDVTFYFPGGPPAMDPPGTDLRKWPAWGRRQGGEDVYFTHALVIIQATQDRTVVLQTPKVIRRRAPVESGAICGRSGLGGNGLLVRRFWVDLNPDIPHVKYIGEDEKESGLFTLKKGEAEGFLLIAEASKDRHEWTITIPCIVDGVAVELAFKENVLVTVGPEGVPRYAWVEGIGWVDG